MAFKRYAAELPRQSHNRPFRFLLDNLGRTTMETFICNQTKIPKDRWRYGLRSSAKVGCGWIAVYNALIQLGESPLPETIIDALEHQLPLIHGNLGTNVLGPAMLLKKWGYHVTLCSDLDRFDRMCRHSDVGILFYYWRKGLRVGAHFVCVTANTEGFWGYNTYTDSKGLDFYGTSLSAYLKEQKRFGCVLTCSRKPKQQSNP